MNTKLKDCPFCGKTDFLFLRTSQPTSLRRVVCHRCEMEGPAAKTDGLARSLWNMRPSNALLAALQGLVAVTRDEREAREKYYDLPPEGSAKVEQKLYDEWQALVKVRIEREAAAREALKQAQV
jgi:Lar family restriction alleviation protein